MAKWQLPKFNRHSMFARIYMGVLLLIIAVVLAAVVLFKVVNTYRLSHYQHQLASAVGHIVAGGINRQSAPANLAYWLDDAQYLLSLPISIEPIATHKFSWWQLHKLKRQQAVIVIKNNAPNKLPWLNKAASDPTFHVYYRLNNHQLIYTHFGASALREQQIQALPIFVLDDLARSNQPPAERLKELMQHAPFNMALVSRATFKLDEEQNSRIRRREVVMTLSNQAASPAITLVAPTTDMDHLLVIGPIKLFTPFPAKLIIAIGILAAALLALGVYGLIVPLQRRIGQVQLGMAKVRGGDFANRIAMLGHSEIAQLSSSFDELTEHIQRLISAQRELSRAVSHELRTPIARIRFGLEMLADSDDAADRQLQKDAIDEDIATLDALVDEILTYAKLEEGTPSLDMQPLLLNDAVALIVKQMQNLSTTVTIGASNTTPVRAMADSRYLQRVLQNLVGNALRYASSQVQVSCGLDTMGRAFVCVEDDGPGISVQNRAKIFEPFARLDDSRTRASGGYGLGLSIVERICYWFDGQMQVDQSPTLRGARFTMRWPSKL